MTILKKIKEKKIELTVWIFVVIGAVILCIKCYAKETSAETAQVIIKVSGKVTESFPLNKDRNVVVTGKNHTTNTVIIENNTATVSEASCPDKLCVHQHAIRKSGESIICLPNEVVVEIENQSEGSADIIAK